MAIKTYKDLLKRVEKIKIDQNLDLSSGEDLSIGIMNLISIEEHLFFTYNKTKDYKYLELLNEVRTMRTTLLKKIIKDYEGEVWCISKHFLAASMRLMEVGTKELKKATSPEQRRRAEDLFKKSYKLYSLFWGLNLSQNPKTPQMPQGTYQGVSVFSKLGDLVQKILDCCRE
jgi:hypothetical protein